MRKKGGKTSELSEFLPEVEEEEEDLESEAKSLSLLAHDLFLKCRRYKRTKSQRTAREGSVLARSIYRMAMKLRTELKQIAEEKRADPKTIEEELEKVQVELPEAPSIGNDASDAEEEEYFKNLNDSLSFD